MHTSGGELSDSARYSIGGRQPPRYVRGFYV